MKAGKWLSFPGNNNGFIKMKKILIILIVVVVSGAGGFFIYKNISAPQEGKISKGEEVSAPIPVQITFLNNTIDPDWSPNGAQIVFCVMEGETKTLYLVNADGSGLKEIGPGFDPSWSLVEDKIAYEMNGQIYTMDSNGKNIVQLTTERTNGQPAWSPDGIKIVYAHYGTEKPSIWMMNADGSGKTRLTNSADGECTFPSFNYDGSKIVYTKGPIWDVNSDKLPKAPNEIWVMNSDGSNKHMIYAPGDSYQWIFQRAWNKNNEILFAESPLREREIPEVGVINSDGSNLRYILIPPKNFLGIPECFYLDPVWDNTGTKIVAVKKVIEGAQNIITFPWE
jgi:Tol biopolymer transport system component